MRILHIMKSIDFCVKLTSGKAELTQRAIIDKIIILWIEEKDISRFCLEDDPVKQWQKTAAYFLAVVLTTAAITAAITANIIKNNKQDTVELQLDEYAAMRDLFVIDEIMDTAEDNALDELPERAEMVERAAKGVVAAFDDPYAAYYTTEEYEAYLANVNGTYNGIGLLIGQPGSDGALVLDVYEEYSAYEAGVRVGDKIIAVNGKAVAQMTLEELSAQIDGEIGSTVKMELIRAGETLSFEVESVQVNVSQVSSALFNERTAYIRINRFTGNCVSEFESALKDKTERGMRSLVIDLRNNPGGTLENVVSIADTLLGNCTIVSMKDKNGKEEIYTGKGKGVNVPIAVLINENSASASEILAAAVQDNEAGTIVGMSSYGKGIVQTTMKLTGNNGWLKLTTQAYYTPNGSSINGIGIRPDIEVDLPDDMKGTPIDKLDQEDDAQLWAALDCVRDKAAEAEQ